MKIEKTIWAVLVLAVILVMPGFSALQGAYTYDVSYKALLDYDGYYYSDIIKYSDLSTQDGVISLLYDIEKPNLAVTYSSNYTFRTPYGPNLTLPGGYTYDQADENGLINATISYQLANGTSYQETFSQYYDFLINPDPLELFIQLRRGDVAFINVYRGNTQTNVTRLQIARTVSNIEVEKKVLPSSDGLVSALSGIVTAERQIFDLGVSFVSVAFKFFYIVIAPVLVILALFWGVNKIKEAVNKIKE